MAEKKTSVRRKKPVAHNEPPAATPNGFAISALVVGIMAILSIASPVWGFLTGAAAIVLGIIGLRQPWGRGLSIAGIITGGVGVLGNLLIIALIIFALVFPAS